MQEKVRLIANLLDDKQAEDIEIYDLDSTHPMFDTVIVASVAVSRNLDAIINEIKKKEKEGLFEVKAYDIENKEWILIDLFDVLVHVFIRESRAHYDIDSILKMYEQK